MVTETEHAKVASAKEARGSRTNARPRLRVETDMGASRGLAGHKAARGPFTTKANARHYVYRLTDPMTSEYYYGRHSTTLPPERDRYTGTGVWAMAAKRSGRILDKQVIREFGSVADALAHERELIEKARGDMLNRNRKCRSYWWRDYGLEQVTLLVPAELVKQVRDYVWRLVAKRKERT